MPETRRIKVIETYYDAKKDLVQWLVLDKQSNKQCIMCWPGKDLGPAVGVNTNKLSKEDRIKVINKFCKDITGKTINMEIHVDMEEVDLSKFGSYKKDVKFDDAGTGDLTEDSKKRIEQVQANLYKEHEKLDKYPFYEILKTLEEDGIYKDSLKDIKREKRYPSIINFLDKNKDENNS